MNHVPVDGLRLFVQEHDAYLLAKERERRRRGTAREHLCCICPDLEVVVVGEAALHRDRLVLRAPEPLEDDRIAALLVVDHGGGARHRADLADRGDRWGAVAEV